MTRDEAISIMNVIVHMLEPQYDTDRIEDAVEMAIKALEQQDKVLDAIKEIKDLFNQPAAYVPNYDAYRLCLSIICKHLEVEE